MNQKLSLSGSGSVRRVVVGRFLYFVLKRASTPVQISFDGNDFKVASQGDTYGPIEAASVWFKAEAGLDSDVEFTASLEPVRYQEQAQSNAPTEAFGNLGIADGAGANNGMPACDANGNLIITNAMALLISGKRNGKRRQMITFAVSKNSPASFAVKDANGKTFKVMDAGDDFAYPTDSDFIVSGAGGNAWVSIGQIFLK